PRLPVSPSPKPAQVSQPAKVPQKVLQKIPQTAPSRQNLRVPLERLTRMSNTVSELLINHERLLTYDQQIRQASRNLKQRNQQLSPLREQVESLYDELTFSEQTSPIYPGNGSSNLADTLTSDFDALQFDRYTAVHSLLQRFQE
ncbi:MAG: hybrid sensor histidine kinase/response regulator, partial [Microcystaceae cyanobacterium]